MNVTRQAIYKWESRKGYPDIQNLIRLSELFEISIDELIKGDSSFQSKIKVKGSTDMISNRDFLSSLNYFHIVRYFNGMMMFGWVLLAIGAYRSRTLGFFRSAGQGLYLSSFLFFSRNLCCANYSFLQIIFNPG